MNFKNCVYISLEIQILTILRYKISQIFTRNYYLLSKFSKLHNLESQFFELLRPRAPPFPKIKINPWNQVTFIQNSCFLGPTIFKIPQPNWYYCTYLSEVMNKSCQLEPLFIRMIPPDLFGRLKSMDNVWKIYDGHHVGLETWVVSWITWFNFH